MYFRECAVLLIVSINFESVLLTVTISEFGLDDQMINTHTHTHTHNLTGELVEERHGFNSLVSVLVFE